MAIIINDNLAVNVGKPVDNKYLNTGTTKPWANIAAVNAGIPLTYRYTGLTVNILGSEYWYKTGVTNTSLTLKVPTGGTAANAVTGATNIGYFSGLTGIQTLPIIYTASTYIGNYYSLYNYYYRGADSKVHIGTPSDNIPRRGYVKTTPTVASWFWDNITSGWILTVGNISNQIGGTPPTVVPYYTNPTFKYTETGWTQGNSYNSGSGTTLTINPVIGNFTTGSTLSIGGPVYANKCANVLDFRTLQTQTPNVIKITDNEAFVYLSGVSSVTLGANVGSGAQIFKSLTGTTLQFRSIQGSGNTIVNQVGDNVIIFSSGGSSTSSVTGERITKLICQVSHGFNSKDVIGWSGGTYNKAIANGLYDGEVIGLVTKCYNSDCFDLTQAGYVTGLTSLSVNTTYFLSDVTPGLLTPTEPSLNGHISKSVMIANSTTSGWVLPYAGYIITSGSSGGGPLIKNVCIPTTSYQVTNNDFFIGANNSIAINLPLAPQTGMVVVVGDICNSASVGVPITITGSLVNGSNVSYITTASGSLSYIFNGLNWNVFAFAPAVY
jgi:hypothetical protein